jgi:hypothetical protein
MLRTFAIALLATAMSVGSAQAAAALECCATGLSC